MYKSHLQIKHLTILYSIGSQPFSNWGLCVQNGCIKRVTDTQIGSFCVELLGVNVSTCYMVSPPPNSKFKSLGIQMPIFSLVVKNLHKYFQLEITVLDDQNIRRRFKASNFNKVTRIDHLCCIIPLTLKDDWNHVKFDLNDFTQRAFKTRFIECVEVKIHGNCRLRRIFFSANDYTLETLDLEYALSLPTPKVGRTLLRKENKGKNKEKRVLNPRDKLRILN